MNVKISTNVKATELVIVNNNDAECNFQLAAYRVEMVNGKEQHIETKDLIINPVSFKLAPNQKKDNIRIGLKAGKHYSYKEKAYRITVKESPRFRKKGDTAVQIVTEFNLPLTIINSDAESA